MEKMKTYIILIRGINVGGKNILPMKMLVSLLEDSGFKDVKTYIQSGNVVLKSDTKPDSEISLAIETNFGFKPEIMGFEKSEFEAFMKNNPFSSKESKFIYFFFCSEKPKVNQEKLQKLKAESEKYQITGKVFYLHAPDGIGRSKLAANIESCLGVSATGRNLNTVNKLQQMARDI